MAVQDVLQTSRPRWDARMTDMNISRLRRSTNAARKDVFGGEDPAPPLRCAWPRRLVDQRPTTGSAYARNAILI